MTPDEARDALVRITEDTAALLGNDGWKSSSEPSVGPCEYDEVDWSYRQSSPIPDADHLTNAQTVAEYWEGLGMTVRIDQTPDPVVYATGGDLHGISFSTGPGTYQIAGTSLCVPGDLSQIIGEEYVD